MATKKWTKTDIPDQSGRVAVITGSNTGLGLDTAKALAGAGAEVVLAVRNTDKGEAARETILGAHPDATVQMQKLDLSSLESISAAVGELRSKYDAIDLLINNAGVMYTKQSKTDDGFELQFGTNHLGHFAFTGGLLDRLLPVEGSRVVTVSSVGHRIRSSLDFDDLNGEKSYDRVAAYGRSKLCNLLFTYELNRRLEASGTTTASLAAHPGVSHTELTRNSPKVMQLFSPLAQSSAMGALPTLRAATDPEAKGGEYYGPRGPAEFMGYPTKVGSSSRSRDTELQRRLWSVSEELTGVSFPV
jgi:NAD(P)-dependent dehydrogenase (short-subunit alcohol dehydrogenase family)